MRRVAGSRMWLTVLAAMLLATGWTIETHAQDRPADPERESDEEGERETPEVRAREDLTEQGRQPLEQLSREDLEEMGFVFEDTLSERERAHATVFALTLGTVLSGAGHWHLDDPGTALTLLGSDLVGWTMMAAGIGLAVRPTGRIRVDDLRQDLWFVGSGLLVGSWMVDVFGTAYRDDLGIPETTRRKRGYGAGLHYRYWRPQNSSLRHILVADFEARNERYELDVSFGQGLEMGVSDLKLDGRWFPLVAASSKTRLGVGVSGRYRWYRIDRPYRRADVAGSIRGALDLGRFTTHLDEMTIGFAAGVGVRAMRLTDQLGRLGAHRYGGWHVPLEMYLALNFTDQLRFQVRWERNTGHWLQRSSGRIGIPTFQLDYRSTENLDLRFFGAFGNGVGFGAGLRVWFGE